MTGGGRPDADLLVVGGGPVGLAAAIEARRRGMSVVVIEPRAAPIDKACGEGLMPSAVDRLRGLGVEPVGRPFQGIRYLQGEHEVTADFPDGAGVGVRRTALHGALADRARALGVQWCGRRVDVLAQDPTGVVAAGLRGRWLLGADGLHSTVRRAVGLDRPGSAAAPRYGVRRHVAVTPWTDHVEVYWGRRCEVYVTPVAEDLVGLAVLGPRGLDLAAALDQLPRLAGRLGGAEAVTRSRGAGPLRQHARAVRRGRVLLVGDAAGYVDALTGEGLSIGMATAQAAVTAIEAGRPQDYDAAWRRETLRCRLLTQALVAAARRGRIRPLVVPAAARAPAVFRAAVGLLA